MSLTPSNMLPLGTSAPDFKLVDTISGKDVELSEIKGEYGFMVMFICNHCPYVKHVQPELVRLAEDYMPQGIGMVAISSNDIENYPEDGPDLMQVEAKKWNYQFPYLFDDTQIVAKKYDAACTPDFYIFDRYSKLVYRGQLDSSRPGNEKPLNGADIRSALDDLLKGNPVSPDQKPSQGCNIKWK